ncbi:MAG: hypothetical protein IKR74_01820 [Bacilli bacterium]|nr:hypothetical protein [Bacilli bacterium]
MTKHLLSSVNQTKKVIKVQKSITYSFSPNSNTNSVNVKKITIYDKDFLSNYVSYKLEKRFQELLILIKKILEDDTSEESSGRCIDLINQYEDILENKYKHYLKIKKYQMFIDKIMLLRKYVDVNTIVNEEELNYNISGGRR